MELKNFIEENLNKWMKIENDDVTIIQKINDYQQTNKDNIVECSGFSISNVEGESRTLDKFYMTSYDMSGKITFLSDETAEKEIQEMENNI